MLCKKGIHKNNVCRQCGDYKIRYKMKKIEKKARENYNLVINEINKK